MKRAILFLIALSFFSSLGCASRNPPNLRASLADVQAPAGRPMLLAVYQPWFGKSSHINVGYSCHDPVVLDEQISKAKALNIGGFVVNWYGPEKNFEDQTFQMLQQVAANHDFKVAVQYDEPVDHPGYNTDVVLSDMQYLYNKYIGPQAVAPREAYLRYNGRPVIFIFPKDGQTDWNKVRKATDAWPNPPVLIYKDDNSKYPNAFDGYYAWVQPGRPGWLPNGSNHGEQYLDHFYKNMTEHHPGKIAVGAVWPGFNDSKAAWRRNRRMDYQCGKTFEEGLQIFRHYYGTENPPPYLLIVTWNDYEEGTDIERGISHCRGGGKTESAAGRP